MRPATENMAKESPAVGGERESLPFVITISREYGSGGHHIGRLVAQRLGMKFYDKELISLTAKESGLSEGIVRDSEQTVSGDIMYDDPTQTAVFRTQSQVILDVAGRESCVIVGRLANFVLKDRPNCLHVFVYADEPARLRRIISGYGVDSNRAEETLRRVDKGRREHCLHYTGHEWGDRHQYHLMLNTSFITEEEAAETICTMLPRQ